MASFQNFSTNAVCNTCRSRKVKCDRNDPCGNCIDGNIQCVRTPPTLRRAQSKRRRSTESEPAPKSISRRDFHVTQSPPVHSASVPHSPSIVEAHDFIRREIRCASQMPADRLAVLNSAMTFVNHLSQVTRPQNALGASNARVTDILEDIIYPSVELLYWMLRELKGNSIGPYVLDYFKHVSTKSLRDMGLALIEKKGDPESLLLYSICVNSAAYKFINTILSVDGLEGMAERLQASATCYINSVKLAMTRIHLLAAPSLILLQSLLCSTFIAQGAGDPTSCWTFITAACKICEDLNLEARMNTCGSETEEEEEMFYCVAWCHILDKNFSMMLGRSRCLLEHDGLDSVFSSAFTRAMSSLFSTYLHFVPIQAIFISELHPTKIANKKSELSRVEYVVTDLLGRLSRMHARITELHGPSDSWDGLYMGSELSTIQFSYHSLRTSILRSSQICSPEKPFVNDECLESARMAMSTLRAIQVEAASIADIRAHVAYMHWTVLYHPLTPFFVLFCHVVSTSSEEDYLTLQMVASGLDRLADLSLSIAKLQRLFKSFIDLCAGVMGNSRETAILSTGEQRHSSQAFSSKPDSNVIQQLPVRFVDESASSSDQLLPQQPPTSQPMLEFTFSAPLENNNEGTDPVWGLFDVQPTLDWLDADFSYFDSNI
ncbi:hypothetical protein B0J11DRAFT_524178 [Dendryphion nanum]|uniref:Zn(2)-C6 fungal-type domain-containing protein n=1 Tax=Dendryphion nanum TaxID=256645 RepID=A0A9P9E6F6_9PLEO|nr:hypothetical protein B0J11DRAFT_524178 [Dendryphion nanum]